MQHVSLSDNLYAEARRRAEVAGFATVDEYLADLLAHDFQLDDENLDHFFTPERLAMIDQAAAEVEAGHTYTMEQVRQELARTSDAWQRDRAPGK